MILEMIEGRKKKPAAEPKTFHLISCESEEGKGEKERRKKKRKSGDNRGSVIIHKVWPFPS